MLRGVVPLRLAPPATRFGLAKWLFAATKGFSPPEVYAVGAAALLVAIVVAALLGRRSGHRALAQRLTALGNRLGIGAPAEETNIETALSYLEQVTGAATEAVADTSADAIRLRRSLDTLSQGVVLCDENGAVVYRNARASALMTSRHGDALAAQAVTDLLEDAWDTGSAERTLDLYGPPRRTLSVRARLIDDGRRPLGVIAMIEDVSERRRLEEIRRDFVANVSHELKTPMGAIGLLAETLVAEPDFDVARRLASRIHTEAFRVSRIIDDLLDLTRIESEEAPPREPVLVNLVMAEAVERVRASAEQRGITITLSEPEPPVAVLGDRRQLVSAMHALIENAVTYSYEHSTVAVIGAIGAAALGAGDSAPPAGSPGTGLGAVASTVVASPGLAATSPDTREPGNEAASPPAAGTPGTPPRSGVEPATTDHLGVTVLPAVAKEPKEAAAPGGTNHGTADQHGATEHGATDGGAAEHGATEGGATEHSATEGGATEHGATEGGAESPPPASSPPLATHAAGAPAEVTTSRGEGNGDRALDRGPREMVRISVVDHGIGIPARDLDRIFERFYRVDHGRSRETGGTGLGLSIVRHVASNHHGWVEVESREGEGSTFTLVLPLQPDRSD